MRSKFEELKRSYFMSLQLQCPVRMTWYLDISTLTCRVEYSSRMYSLSADREKEAGLYSACRVIPRKCDRK